MSDKKKLSRRSFLHNVSGVAVALSYVLSLMDKTSMTLGGLIDLYQHAITTLGMYKDYPRPMRSRCR